MNTTQNSISNFLGFYFGKVIYNMIELFYMEFNKRLEINNQFMGDNLYYTHGMVTNFREIHLGFRIITYFKFPNIFYNI